MDFDDFLSVLGGCMSLLTYVAVVYAAFNLKTEERRQQYVSMAICVLSLMPPCIAFYYEDLDLWEVVLNGGCLCAYCICLVRELWINKSKVFFVVPSIAILSAGSITLSFLQYAPERRVEYSAFLSFLVAAIPAAACYITRWRFSYMDSYITLAGAVAAFISPPSDSSPPTTFLTWITSATGVAYSAYAFYAKRRFHSVGAQHREGGDIEMPDRFSVEARHGSEGEKGIWDILEKMESKKRGPRGTGSELR